MKKILFFLICCSFLISSCGENKKLFLTSTIDMPSSNGTTIVATPTETRLKEGYGGIKGIVEVPTYWAGYNLYAYAAPYLGDPEGEGIYILDDKLNQYGKLTPDGYFQIIDINPGIYIIVIGPDVDSAKAYRKEGVALKIEVISNLYADVGIIGLDN